MALKCLYEPQRASESLYMTEITGQQVATWANEGLHGGKNLASNTPHVWDETMANTVDNGALLRDAVAYLRSQGFTVRV